jgi:hypothetical protein
MNSEMKLDVEDVIDVLTAQRNAALDEIARQGALIKKLMRESKQQTPLDLGSTVLNGDSSVDKS